MGNTHGTTIVANTTVSANKTPEEFANELIKRVGRGYVKMDGFRFEFNGTPVLCYNTGKTFTASPNSSYWTPGEHPVMEYMIIRKYNDTFTLYKYHGPAGGQWTGEVYDKLVDEFKKMNV